MAWSALPFMRFWAVSQGGHVRSSEIKLGKSDLRLGTLVEFQRHITAAQRRPVLMSETSAGKPQPGAIPLNIYVHREISFDALSLSRHATRRARARGCSQVPRSAFLEGARKAGGTKTYSGAIVKQKTAVPQGAASLSLAVLESEGKKGSGDRQCGELNRGCAEHS
jgi:hypothetical protein